jgi:hypothetical protein
MLQASSYSCRTPSLEETLSFSITKWQEGKGKTVSGKQTNQIDLVERRGWAETLSAQAALVCKSINRKHILH